MNKITFDWAYHGSYELEIPTNIPPDTYKIYQYIKSHKTEWIRVAISNSDIQNIESEIER